MAEHSYAAFVGFAPVGPINTPILIASMEEFELTFGGVWQEAFLGHAVHGFFANGGHACYVVRINDIHTSALKTDDFVGSSADRTGLGGLAAIKDLSVICVPDVMTLYAHRHIGMDGVLAVQKGLITHCEMMGDRIAILDGLPDLTPEQIKEWCRDDANYDSKHAVLYYPWIGVFDPTRNKIIHVPPCGHLAGVYAHTDLRHGPAHAPANERIQGAVNVQIDLLKSEQDFLNPIGINALVSSAGRGLLVWGARTLSSDPAWRYLRKRRLMNFLIRNIRAGTEWVIFERYKDSLLQRISDDLSDFFTLLWRTGALRGENPEESYIVKCDKANNPIESRDAGLICADCAIALDDAYSWLDFRVVYFLG